MAKSEMRLIVSEQCYLRAQSYGKVRLRMRNFQRFLYLGSVLLPLLITKRF